MTPPRTPRMGPSSEAHLPATATTSSLRSPGQHRRLYGLLGQMKKQMPEADAEGLFRAAAREVSGQEHTSRLTPEQADGMIRRLEAAATRAPAPAAEPDRPLRVPWGPRGDQARDEGRITPEQQEVLGSLFQMAGMDTPERRRGFSMRQCKKPWPQTMRDADTIFEGLSAIILRTCTAKDVLERLEALWASPWIQGHAFFRVFVPDLKTQLEARGKKALSPNKLKKIAEGEMQAAARGGP